MDDAIETCRIVLNIVLVIGAISGGYFMPSIVAFARKHHQTDAIATLNFFLGWTLIGWVIAFVWAMTATPTSRVEHRSYSKPRHWDSGDSLQ